MYKRQLLDWRTIYKNVLLGLEIQHQLDKESVAYAEAVSYTHLDVYKRQPRAFVDCILTKPCLAGLDGETAVFLCFLTNLLYNKLKTHPSNPVGESPKEGVFPLVNYIAI